MGKKERERIGQLEAEGVNVLERVKALEDEAGFFRGAVDGLKSKVEALEVDRPGQAFTPTEEQTEWLGRETHEWTRKWLRCHKPCVVASNAVVYDEVDNIEEAAAPEPTLWWFEDQFWVKSHTRDTVCHGDVYLTAGGYPSRSPGLFRPASKEAVFLRPAKTFPATDARPGLVESGEVRTPRPGIGDSKEWFLPAQWDRPMYNAGPLNRGPRPILIPLSEARRRCGLDDPHEAGLPGSIEDRLAKAIRQRDEAEERVEKLEADLARLEPLRQALIAYGEVEG